MILVNSGAFLSISSWFSELTELIFVMIPYISSTGYPPKRKGLWVCASSELMKIIAPLKPISFQPSTYNLTDHGAMAIIEMNILASGKRLFVVGGSSFQGWQVDYSLIRPTLTKTP